MRLWRTYQVDEQLRDEWLGQLNSLKVFRLISICQGHESTRPNPPTSWPHIHLRLGPERVPLATSMIFGGVSNSFPILEASTQEALGYWTLEYRRRIRLVPAQEFAGGPSDDLVVRIQPSRRMSDESDRQWINQWFEIVIPEIQKCDSQLANMEGR